MRNITNSADPILDFNGNPVPNVLVVAHLVDGSGVGPNVYDVITGSPVQARVLETYSDANGVFTLSLWENERGSSPTYWRVVLRKGYDVISSNIVTVPAGIGDLQFNQLTAPLELAYGLVVPGLVGVSDIRAFFDGQNGRPTLIKWMADQQVFHNYDFKFTIIPQGVLDGISDCTAAIQAAVDYNHGKTGKVLFPPGVFTIDGTVYVQKDTRGDGSSDLWRPIVLQGNACYRGNDPGNGGEGATILYKRNAGAMFSVNLDSTGLGVSINPDAVSDRAPDSDWHIFRNFSVADISFLGTAGVQTTAIKGWCVRANLRRLSFSALWRGWDFYDADINGRESYNDFWSVDDIWASMIGDHLFRQTNADASEFRNIHCESFQSTAVGGFKMFSGRGFHMTGMLFNWLPITANYVGHLFACNQVVIECGHFEENLCATADTSGLIPPLLPGATVSANGILLEECGGCRVSNNEFFNLDTPGSQPTRPNVYLFHGSGKHIVTGNNFINSRTLSTDVADIAKHSLVYNNVYLDKTLAIKPDSFYRDPYSVPTSNYGSIFPTTPILTTDIPLDAIDVPMILDTPVWSGSPVTVKTNGNDVMRVTAAGSVHTTIVTALEDNAETTIGDRNYSTAGMTALRLASIINTTDGGVNKAVSVNPTYNQTSGNATNYDFRVMRTETAVGSGTQRLITAGVLVAGNYLEFFGVDNKGGISNQGAISNHANGAASLPAFALTGSPFTGGTSTTTKPLALMEDSGNTSNTWNTSGTYFGINQKAGFTGDALNIMFNGTSVFKVDYTGTLHCTAGGFVGDTHIDSGDLLISSAGKGVKMTNAAGTITKRVRLNDAGNGLIFE